MNAYSRTRTIYLFWQMNVRLQRQLERHLATFAMTPGQYVVMSHLQGRHQYSSAELAKRTGVSPQSTSELVVVLEKNGFITRHADRANRRIRRMSLTAKGLAALAEIDRVVDQIEADLFQHLTGDDHDRLRTQMIQMLQHLSDAG